MPRNALFTFSTFFLGMVPPAKPHYIIMTGVGFNDLKATPLEYTSGPSIKDSCPYISQAGKTKNLNSRPPTFETCARH